MTVDSWLPSGESVKLESPIWSNTAPPCQHISALWKWEPGVTKTFDFSQEAPNSDVYIKHSDFKMLATNLKSFNNEKFPCILANKQTNKKPHICWSDEACGAPV